MTSKKIIFAALLILLNLVVLELVLSEYYFQTNSYNSLAIVHYLQKTGKSLNKSDLAPIDAKRLIKESRRAEAAGTNKEIRHTNNPTGSVGIWQTDEKFGYSHIPYASGIHKTKDFTARYTIGGDQERFSPVTGMPSGRMLFLGGSFTFGHGVNNNETYPAVLGKKYWNSLRMVNKAVAGWGAYMTLLDELSRPTAPAIVFYAYIPHHARRNYISKYWVEFLGNYARKHPHFELVGGVPEFQGVVGVAEGVKYTKEVRRKELALTNAFLVAMSEKCKEKNVPFIFINLPSPEALQAEVVNTIHENNIAYIDLSDVVVTGFATDKHPNPEDHEKFAKMIFETVTDMLQRGAKK